MKTSLWFLTPRWRVVWFLAVAAALNFGDRTAMSAVLSAVQTDLQISNVLLGLLGSVFLWSYAIGSPLAGGLADRYSRTKMVVGSLAAWSLVTGLIGLATNYPILLFLRFSLGLTECLFLPAAVALIATYHPPATRARAMSFITIGANCGMVLGGTAAGFFADRYGWRSGFWVLGSLGVGMALLAKYLLPSPPAVVETAGERKEKASFSQAVRYLLRVPSYYVLLGESILSGLGMWIFFTWLPLYFRDAYKMTLASAGFAGTFMLQIAVVLGVMAGGWISDRAAAHAPHRRMLLYAIFYLIGGPFLLLFLGHATFPVVAFGISMFSLMRGLAQANDYPIQCEIVPAQYRSTGVGLMNACATAAGGCGVFLAGFLKEDIGLGGIFAAISGIFVLAGVLLAFGYFACIRKDIARAQAWTSGEELKT